LTAAPFGTMLDKRVFNRNTQPDSIGMLCAADNESPSTRTVCTFCVLTDTDFATAPFTDVAALATLLSKIPPATNPQHTIHPRYRRMTDSSRALLETRDVSKSVSGPEGKLDILQNVSLQIQPGESFAIVGASGSGKTTLLGLLAGLDTPNSGSILLDGNALEQMDEEARADLRRRLVGFVFQSFHLLPALTAEENVMLPLELEGSSDARARARAALEAVGLGARRKHYPAQLSGGEQQRVAIARAFVHSPRVLFADEPTGNLDQRTGHHICDMLFALNRDHHTTLVLVTHDAMLAARCDRRIELEEGRVVLSSNPANVASARV
jgi:putative ABC transport system ATP-binding protein